MKTIEVQDAGKRYQSDWVFRQVTTQFHCGESFAILGPNGSGKSTFLKALSGYLTLSDGHVKWVNDDGIPIEKEKWYTLLSFVAPYIELLEEFTVQELLTFHFQFKPLPAECSIGELLHRLKFDSHRHKLVRDLSSGMRQRLKLITAIVAQTPVLLLDEPATNLDAEGVAWYHGLIEEFATGKCVIVASNRADEYEFCTHQCHMTEWK